MYNFSCGHVAPSIATAARRTSIVAGSSDQLAQNHLRPSANPRRGRSLHWRIWACCNPVSLRARRTAVALDVRPPPRLYCTAARLACTVRPPSCLYCTAGLGSISAVSRLRACALRVCTCLLAIQPDSISPYLGYTSARRLYLGYISAYALPVCTPRLPRGQQLPS